MTGDYRFRSIPGIFYFMFTLLLSGCIAENTDDCYTGIPLTVELPADISPQAMKDISLYVFDDKDRLLDVFAISGMEPVTLNYPDIPMFHCVALCNTQDGTMSVSPPEKGGACSDGFISLKPAEPTRAEQDIFTSPADLLYGELEIKNNTTHASARKTNYSCLPHDGVNEYNPARIATAHRHERRGLLTRGSRNKQPDEFRRNVRRNSRFLFPTCKFSSKQRLRSFHVPAFPHCRCHRAYHRNLPQRNFAQKRTCRRQRKPHYPRGG